LAWLGRMETGMPRVRLGRGRGRETASKVT